MFLFLYRIGIHLASLWNPKAKKWVAGRKLQQSAFTKNTLQPEKRIWMHCASLGEYEQGLPVLEQLRGLYPDHSFIITFFSPSGYEPVVKKMNDPNTRIFYLPLSSKEADKFIEFVSPNLVIWVKYDYWLHYLLNIRKRNIPFLLVSAIFRQDQPFFKWYGSMHRRMLACFTEIFVQNETSRQLLKTQGFENCIVSGDTRFDRVAEIATRFEPISIIEEFIGNHPCLVAGSTWKQDEEMISKYANANHSTLKWIIAPHEVNKHHLKELKELFPDSVFFSELKSNSSQLTANSLLIIDNIGMLSRLYKYASLTYIGGGFGKEGVHNVLEAAVYGKPVIFVPIYYQFHEAKELIEQGGGISIKNDDDFAARMNMLIKDEKLVKDMSAKAAAFVTLNTGASKKIVGYIQEKRLLTS